MTKTILVSTASLGAVEAVNQVPITTTIELVVKLLTQIIIGVVSVYHIVKKPRK